MIAREHPGFLRHRDIPGGWGWRWHMRFSEGCVSRIQVKKFNAITVGDSERLDFYKTEIMVLQEALL